MSRNSTAGSSIDENPHCTWKGDGATVFRIIAGVSTVLLNTVVLAIAATCVTIRRAPNQLLVISMTLGDLLFGLCFIIGGLVVHCLPDVLCGPFFVSIWCAQSVSVFSLLLLNINKVSTIRNLSRKRLSVRSATLQILGIWLTAVLLCAFTYYGPFVRKPHHQICHVYFSPDKVTCTMAEIAGCTYVVAQQ